jgi:hypothetical protein
MWYYNGEIIKTPKTMTIGDLQYSKELFQDADKMAELGIKNYRSVKPDSRYFRNGAYSVDESGDEVVGTYAAAGKDTDELIKQMLSTIKRQLTSRLETTDWYYLRKLRTGIDVPSDIQDYSDALYSEYDTKKSEIAAMSKISQIQEYENRLHTEVRKVKHTDEDNKVTYGPKTESSTREINMCNHWTASPNDKVDPSFVSLTAD